MVNSGPLVNKTTHNRLVYTNPGPLGAALTVKKCFTVPWDCYNTFRTRRYLRSFGKDTVVLTSMAKTADYMAKEEPSVEALQEQMRLAMSDAQLRAEKSALCREKSRTFSPEYVVRRWEKLFESIHR